MLNLKGQQVKLKDRKITTKDDYTITTIDDYKEGVSYRVDGKELVCDKIKIGEKVYMVEEAFKNGKIEAVDEEVQKQIIENIERNGKINEENELAKNREQEQSQKEEDDKNSNLKKELLKKVQTYGFEGFLHTTELGNLKSIIEHNKLIPRDSLVKKRIKFKDKANRSVIYNTDASVTGCCRFYYYFKTPTNYKAEYDQPIIIVFDEKLIFESNVFFSEENAARSNNPIIKDVDDVLRFKWDGIFERGSYTSSKYENKGKEYITGIRNAEFLVEGEVPLSYVKKIYFKSEDNMEEAKKIASKELSDKFCLDGSKFC